MAEVGGVVAVSRISVVSEDEGDVDDVDMLVQRNEEMRQELERDEMEQQQHQQYDTSSTSKHNEMEIETDHVWEAPETASMSLSDDEDKVRSVTSEASDATSQQPSSPAPVWFCRRSEDCKGPQQQMFDRADELGHTVYVASDGQGGNGSKVYTSFMDHAELTVMLISNYNNQQPSSYYEITREGKPCKLHLDTEWESSMGQREAHIRLSNVVSKLEKKLKEETGISPEIIVLDGSRAKKGDVVKHSFHIIASNVVFTSNCGRMKSFTEGFVAENSDDPLFFCGVDCKGKPKCIIDLGIYTKNRCFRTEYSHKKDDATHTKLQRIVPIESKDEYGNGFIVWEKRPATSSSIELLDSFVTCIPDGLAVIPDHVQPVRSQSSRASGSGAGIARVSRAGDVSVSLTAEVAAMQEFMVDKGINDVEVVSIRRDGSSANGVTTYTCRNIGTRKCKSNPNETHTSNNAFLRHHPDGSVHYACLAPSCSTDCGEYKPVLIGKLQPLDDVAHSTIFELALLGPAETFDDALAVIKMTVAAVGGRVTDSVKQDLYYTIQKWLDRSSKLAHEDKKKLQDKMESTMSTAGSVFGCKDALSELWSMRQHHCAIRFKGGADLVCTPDGDPTVTSFLRSVDVEGTHMRSLVLYTRLLWPDSHDIVHEYVRMCSKEQACGFQDVGQFDSVWNVCHDVQSDTVVASVRKHFRNSVVLHPFIRDVIPELTGHRVSSYVKNEQDLRFTLDDGTALSCKLEYRLDFYTGDIRAEGHGVVYQLYGMKKFFVDGGSTQLMAEMLPRVGIKAKMMFDSVEKVWRIFDSKTGIWRYQLSKHEPQSIVGHKVEEQLRPLILLESFLGMPLPWVGSAATCGGDVDDSKSDDCNDEDDDAETENDAEDDDEDGSKKRKKQQKKAACAAKAAGKKRKQGKASEGCDDDVENVSKQKMTGGSTTVRSKISPANFRFGQTLKDQTEVLKMLEQHVLLDFSKQQQKHLLCCPNGVVDLRTGELLGLPTPDQYITQLCTTIYDPNADMQPAIDFFQQSFPVEAYPDSIDLVCFLQQYGGYSLTLETNLQFCLFVYGKGSNAKSLWFEVLSAVWGREMRSTVPIESLSKGRGTNNDSLSNAMNSRLVVVNESNGPAKLDTGTFNALICGEETTHKKMYQEEVNSDPTMKWLFLLNDLPEFEKGAYHSARRCAFLPMKKIYYDHERDLDKQLMAEHRARGGLECLIGTKDILYYQNHVQGKEGSFLRFFVEGAKAYYGAGQKINLPPTMQFQAKSETMDVTTAIDDFVFERLAFEDGKKVLVADMHTEFLTTRAGSGSVGSAPRTQADVRRLFAEKGVDPDLGWRVVPKDPDDEWGCSNAVHQECESVITSYIFPVLFE